MDIVCRLGDTPWDVRNAADIDPRSRDTSAEARNANYIQSDTLGLADPVGLVPRLGH